MRKLEFGSQLEQQSLEPSRAEWSKGRSQIPGHDIRDRQKSKRICTNIDNNAKEISRDTAGGLREKH